MGQMVSYQTMYHIMKIQIRTVIFIKKQLQEDKISNSQSPMHENTHQTCHLRRASDRS